MRAVVIIKGGLGNQLFQLVKAIELSTTYEDVNLVSQTLMQENQRNFYLSDFLGMFKPACKVSTLTRVEFGRLFLARQLRKFRNPMSNKLQVLLGVYFDQADENNFPFNTKLKSHIYEGYWLKVITSSEIEDRLYLKLEEVIQRNAITESKLPFATAHVRGGDYVSNLMNYNNIGLLDEQYYINAFKILDLDPFRTELQVVTDDFKYAESVMRNFPNSNILDPAKLCLWDSLLIMSKSNNLIIGNSTFGLWGAWLCSKNGGRVVMPRNWYRTSSSQIQIELPGSFIVESSWQN